MGVVIFEFCVPGKHFPADPPLLSRNAGRVEDVCALRCRETNAEDFGLVGRMGASELAE